MEDEIEEIQNNNSWELFDHPKHWNVIGVKWIYKLKHNDDGRITKYNSQLVAKGYV